MKQVLLYSLLLCSLLLGAAACSSDDAEIMGPALTDVNADYHNSLNSKTLELYYSGKVLTGSGRMVTFYSEDKQKATITIKNVIPGIEVLALPEVLLTSSKDQTQFSFGGTVKKTDCTVEYEGTVAKGKMSLTLFVGLTANDAVAGRWALQEIIPGDGKVNKKQPVVFTWDTTESFEGFELIISGIEVPYPSSSAAGVLGKGFSDLVTKTKLIKEVTLRSDGNMIVVYAKSENNSDPIWQESDLNALQYYIRDNRFYLVMDENLLEDNPNDGSLIENIKIVLQQYKVAGVPFGFDATADGKLTLYLDKEVLGSQKVINRIPEFARLLPETSEYVLIPLLQNVFTNYAAAINETTKIQLGLNFSKVKQGT